MKNRDIKLDILKVIGILFIILAHVIPQNSLLFQLRNFDVPLMVIVSGILFERSSASQEYSFVSYLKRRIPRLIAPIWFFLFFFFILVYIIESIKGSSYPFSPQIVVLSFFLVTGIQYVWIIRVFTLIAIFSPLLVKLRQRCAKEHYFLLCLLTLYILYEFVYKLISVFPKPPSKNPLEYFFIDFLLYYITISQVFFYVVPYGCLFGLGMALLRISQKLVTLVGITFLTIFLYLGFHYYQVSGFFVPIQEYKIPPTLYYISYGIFMSIITYSIVNCLCDRFNYVFSKSNLFTESIMFISSSTLWIYLWHILFVQYLQYENVWSQMFPKASHYLIRYLAIVTLSIVFTYMQKKIVYAMIQKTLFGQRYDQLLTTLFLK